MRKSALLYIMTACALTLFALLPVAWGQDSQYPADNDADYYYDYYSHEKTATAAEKQYPQDNDEDYYQNYYYNYRAKQGGGKEEYYPDDDEEITSPSGSGYEDYYQNNAPAKKGQGYYDKAYPEDNDSNYRYPIVNQYD